MTTSPTPTMGKAMGAGPFNAKILIWVVAAAILGVVAYLFLATYAPDLENGNNGEGHALSQSAIGYSGLVKLERALGHPPEIVHDEEGLKTDGLLVVTPELNGDADELAKLVKARDGKPTLVVLPGYVALADLKHPGWVREGGGVSPDIIERLIAKTVPLKITFIKTHVTAQFDGHPAPVVVFGPDYFAAHHEVGTVTGDNLKPILTDDSGNDLSHSHIVLADAGNGLYILAEPDLFNNFGIADPHRAYAAVKLLAVLSPAAHPQITFDLTLNGFKSSGGLLDLILRPPFLAMTLALLVAAVMALINGLVRFGPPMREARAIPRGKGALVANTAEMLKLAKVEHQLGGRYAALIRDLAAHDFGVPLGSAEVMTQRLDTLKSTMGTFSDLAQRAEGATDRTSMVHAAQALDAWRQGSRVPKPAKADHIQGSD